MSSTARALLTTVALLAAGCAATPPDAPPTEALLMHPVADETFTMPDGTVLPARVWLPTARPPIVMLALHGFNDSRDAWALSAPVFAAAGIAVFAPDQRGFGDTATRGTWPGAAALVDDAGAMARGLRQRFPDAKLFVVGESMGGAVAMDLAATDGPPAADGTIMLAPAVWGRPEQGLVLAGALWVANGVAPDYRLTASDVPVKVMPSDNRDALVALARDPLTLHGTPVSGLAGLVDLMDSAQAAAPHVRGPALVAYGARDTLVPDSAMGVAWAKLPPEVRRAVYPNGYHLLTRDRGRRAVIEDLIAWMQAPAALLPSGADMAAGAWATTHHPGGGLTF